MSRESAKYSRTPEAARPVRVPRPTARITLPADGDAPRRARALADTLAGGTEQQRSDIRLLISELVTNAVQYGREPIVVTIGAAEGPVRIEVSDAGPGPPHHAIYFDRLNYLGGYGLDLVEALSDRWGARGSTLWFELDGEWNLQRT